MNTIKPLIDWLNHNQGATLALLTAIYVLATLVLVIVTLRGTRIAQRSLQAAERFERERARPYVTMSLVNRPLSVIQFRIENVGATAAYDIRINMTPELFILEGGENVYPSEESEKPHPFIRRGLPYLPPKAFEMNVITLSFKRFQTRYPQQRFEGTITYSDMQKASYTDPLLIDMSVQEGLSFISDSDIGAELKKLREAIERKKA
ncbi:MAG: hypothetical protein ABI946_00825 [Chthoniobacterales bacterium]